MILEFETTVVEGEKVDSKTRILEEFCGSNWDGKEYAILSHCWAAPEQEVSFQDIEKLVTTNGGNRSQIRERTGYQKIIDTCKQAQKDHLEWVWVDTCCIDKKSSSELSESINSMYLWYKNAKLCYVHLHDIPGCDGGAHTLAEAKWFTRGWTLQELIAPNVIHFFNQRWELIGDKKSLAPTLSKITRVSKRILEEGLDSERPSVTRVFSWAADRQTMREEDRAYSLLGLLGVHMPMVYGERKNAFRRLQLQIMRRSNDHSILAWGHSRMTGWSDSFLADDPSCFKDCANVISLTHDEFTKALEEDSDVSKEELSGVSAKRLRTFAITNDGIKIWLPTTTVGSTCLVALACRDNAHALITIRVAVLPSISFRLFGDFTSPGTMEFKEHFLPYYSDSKCPSDFTFELDCRTLSEEGFVQRHVRPTGLHLNHDGGSVTLSKANGFAVVTYVRDKDYVSILLGYWGGRHSVSVAFLPEEDLDKEQLACLLLRALDSSINEDPKYDGHFIQHAHLPRSIRCIRIVHRVSQIPLACCAVTIDITRCSGCCSPQGGRLLNSVETPQALSVMSDLLKESPSVYRNLLVDFSSAPFLPTESEIKLGDYGRLSDLGQTFERHGNIFEHVVGLGIDIPPNSIIDHAILNGLSENPLIAQIPAHEANDFYSTSLALYGAVGRSLPATGELVRLLKALSFRLASALLVTTVIQCSECYYDHRETFHFHSFEPSNPKTWKQLQTSTPLHTALTPIYWCPVPPCPELVRVLKDVRRNFFVLVGRLGEPNDSSQTATIENAAKFFVDVFGGDNFKDFIGEITFFRELPSMAAGEIGSKAWAKTDNTAAISWEQRVEALSRYLMEINAPHIRSKLRKRETEWRSNPFGVEFLQTIGAIYREWKPGSLRRDDVLGSCELLTKTEEIEKLQEALDGTSDKDERRTLMEDMTGKILSICWRGISLEIKRVLGTVTDRFVNDSATGKHVQKARADHVYKIGHVFKEMTHHLPDYGLDPLRRIMHDARAGVSKHQYLTGSTIRCKL